MCGSVLYHENDKDNLDVYFAGPFALSMNLQKTDVFSKYTFQYTWTTDQTNAQHEHVTANFDTPGILLLSYYILIFAKEYTNLKYRSEYVIFF